MRRRARRVVAHALLCAVASCSTAPATPPDTLVVALESAPATLDPRFTTDANSSLVGALVTSGLTTTDAHAAPAPDLAARWRRLAPTVWEFRLRPDARFHDGAPVTASDVAATYRSVLDEGLGSPKREAVRLITRITTPDPRTVVFELAEPLAAFLDTTSLGILPARLVATGPLAPAAVVGSGPFRIAEVGIDGSVDLLPHAAYMDGAPHLARVRFRIVPDGVVRALELASGTVHLVQNAVEPDLVPWLARQPGLTVEISPGTTFQYLGLNLRDPRLADRRVRRALAHAIDREVIVRHLLRGTARLATGLLPPSHWAYEGRVPVYPHDPARARALLAASGLGQAAAGRHFSYKTSTVELRRRIAEVLQAELAEIGLGLTIRSYEWATFYADIRRGNFELYALAWVGVQDPDVYYRIFHSAMTPPAGNNRGGYRNPRVDALLVAARRAPDRERRRRLYGKVQRLLAADLPIVPLWWADNVTVRTERLVGFTPAPDGDLRSLARARFVSDGAAAPEPPPAAVADAHRAPAAPRAWTRPSARE